MRRIIFIIFLITLSKFAEAQQSVENILSSIPNKEQLKITKVSGNIYKFEYPAEKVRYKELNYVDNTPRGQVNTISIDLRFIDTALYSRKYTFWQDVTVSTHSFSRLVIGDVNKNGQPEIYGWRKEYNTARLPCSIFELDSLGRFRFAHQYNDSIKSAKNIYDINYDNREQIYLSPRNRDALIYKSETDTSLPIIEDFRYNEYTSQKDNPTFGDFDKDGKTDFLFDLMTPSKLIISEYNPIINNFQMVYEFDYPELEAVGFAVGDFDKDGKIEMVLSTINGNVYVTENVGDNLYTSRWIGNVGYSNAYMLMSSNDIDFNKRKEFWVGGDTYVNGIRTQRFTCFEARSDNVYAPVAILDLIGSDSFWAGNSFAVDVDKDGVEELFFCLDQTVLILKFIGSRDFHNYEVYYIKRNEYALNNQNSVYYNATMYDLTGDGKKEILINLDIIDTLGQKRDFTQIYRPDLQVYVGNDNKNVNTGEYFIKNYPNPFGAATLPGNSTTKIRFNLLSQEYVQIEIYNLLGEKIKELINETLLSGEHLIYWDGKNDFGKIVPNVPSGY